MALSRRGCITTMADRYRDRPFPAQESYDRHDRGGDSYGADRVEGDPLAELARLIGQTDTFADAAKAPPHPLQSRALAHPQYDLPEDDLTAAPGPPRWMQRARHETVPPPLNYDEPDYQPAPVHPLHRYAAQHPQASGEDQYESPQYAAAEPRPDPSRYDDALYGKIESGGQEYQRDPAYPDDPYAYQDDYEEEPEPKKRSTGLMTIAAVVALAVVGTGAAFGYRTYVGSPRGEPPIIKADNSPTKVVPAPSGGSAPKTPDRLLPGDGSEKLVSREEAPVDVNVRSGAPRLVFPSPNLNASSLPVGSVPPAGALPASEPRKVKTLAVKGDASENGGVPTSAIAPPARTVPLSRSVTAPAAAPPAGRNPASANASANSPIPLTPQGAPPSDPAPTRLAATNPVQAAPSASGGYLVQVSSQKTEADAQASYRTLQSKFQAELGSRPPLIKRADLGEKGVFYRAMVGPFNSSEEATQFCMSLKSAGGQCFVPRN